MREHEWTKDYQMRGRRELQREVCEWANGVGASKTASPSWCPWRLEQKLISPQFCTCKDFIGECFPRDRCISEQQSQKEGEPNHESVVKLATTPWGHPRNPQKWIPGLCLLGKKGETSTHGLSLTTCQSAKPHTTQECRMHCVVFSMEQGPMASHSGALTEKLQSREQGMQGPRLTVTLHPQEVGLSSCRTNCHSNGRNERQVKPRRSEMVGEQYLIQSLKH